MARKKMVAEEVTKGPKLQKCVFCKKSSFTDPELINHQCELKRRYDWMDEPHSRFGFMAYNMVMKSINRQKKGDYTHMEFVKSSHYIAFVKFGKFCFERKVFAFEKYIKFLLKMNIKVDKWIDDHYYMVFLRELAKTEDPYVSLERTIITMADWADEHEQDISLFFKEINTIIATNLIKSGRLSCWVLYSVGMELFDRMSEEQLEMTSMIINPEYWDKKFLLNKETVKDITALLKEHGIVKDV